MADYEYNDIKAEIEDGIAWLTLNRPEKRNAMSPRLHYEMDNALDMLETDPAAKVVVISGAGGNFSAGLDLKKFFRELDSNPNEQRRAGRLANRWRWERLYDFDKPTIAMVEGYCVGGAFTPMLGADFALAAENASFCLSEVNWGIIPGGLVSKAVTDSVLFRHAMYYCCLGEPFDGKEAARIGMVNAAVPQAELRAKTIELAQKLMKKSPAVLRATKQAVRHVRKMDYGQSYEYLKIKDLALMVGDSEDSYNSGLQQFIDKSYKPAHQPFALREETSTEKSK